MKNMYFICDESGAKGFSDKQERYLGEVGVMAGFIIPEEYLDKIRSDFDGIGKYFFTEGKMHITDLQPASQEKLRVEIFDYIKKKNIPCLYEAIHSEGFYEHYQSISNPAKKAEKRRVSGIKISGNKTTESLHEELFQGVFGKAVALCTDHIGKEFNLIVRIDRIDKTVKGRFENAANKLLTYGEKENVKKVTGFDLDQKKVVTGAVISKLEDPGNLLGDFSGVKFSIELEESSLTLAADVIVNSLYHHFKIREEKVIGDALNAKESIKGHPLANVMYGLWDDGGSNYFSDAAFMHPRVQHKNNGQRCGM